MSTRSLHWRRSTEVRVACSSVAEGVMTDQRELDRKLGMSLDDLVAAETGRTPADMQHYGPMRRKGVYGNPARHSGGPPQQGDGGYSGYGAGGGGGGGGGQGGGQGRRFAPYYTTNGTGHQREQAEHH
ncbi:unnamed protein product [Vitrella brassicaformis CCMP3155]|uniref:Uncharacterized protein n=1 Tax=Vitrella brassicaformis (strain CCMP3155) TaxID=1169540 RepID=A0A0G4FIP1_VITBC|nr:unnamed protein product [Vitrella brassicaformis CCMP3155]|eukprot:CEM12977.1 unnamed protein product [Vitrella brassicaformis CCMP3155]